MSELLTAMGTSHGGQRVGSEASMPCDIFWTALMRSAEGSPDLRESSSATLNLEFEIIRRLFARARPWQELIRVEMEQTGVNWSQNKHKYTS